MLTRSASLVVFWVLGLFWIDSAPAVAEGSSGQGAATMIMFAAHDAVQTELGMDDEVASEARMIAGTFGQEMQIAIQKKGLGLGAMQKLRGLNEAERAAKMKVIRAQTGEINARLTDKFLPRLKKALTDDQFSRLQEITWQALGSQAMTDPGMSEQLQLTSEQTEKIGVINDDYSEREGVLVQSAFRGGGEATDFQAIDTKLQALASERDTKVRKLLTKSQQQKYLLLRGKPFDMSALKAGLKPTPPPDK
ncbi:MAG: hypothetical protein ACKV0T_18105 [Planctomycetales bacterium]